MAEESAAKANGMTTPKSPVTTQRSVRGDSPPSSAFRVRTSLEALGTVGGRPTVPRELFLPPEGRAPAASPVVAPRGTATSVQARRGTLRSQYSRAMDKLEC